MDGPARFFKGGLFERSSPASVNKGWNSGIEGNAQASFQRRSPALSQRRGGKDGSQRGLADEVDDLRSIPEEDSKKGLSMKGDPSQGLGLAQEGPVPWWAATCILHDGGCSEAHAHLRRSRSRVQSDIGTVGRAATVRCADNASSLRPGATRMLFLVSRRRVTHQLVGTHVGRYQVPLPSILNRPDENGRSQGGPESARPPPVHYRDSLSAAALGSCHPLFTLSCPCRSDRLLVETVKDTDCHPLQDQVAFQVQDYGLHSEVDSRLWGLRYGQFKVHGYQEWPSFGKYLNEYLQIGDFDNLSQSFILDLASTWCSGL
ncbi:hypothetical protein QBC43DRAFT_328822 [Cladorrhinum sp. PSN259]|nr:hypothetical protein QBC43DRAFT_328822 [Cladorrhinum sp. PSN259]